jgi:proline iminopeptidase
MDAQVADMEAVRAKFDFQSSTSSATLTVACSPWPTPPRKTHPQRPAAPAWKDIVRVLPDVFPDVLEQIAAREKKRRQQPQRSQPANPRSLPHALYSEANRDSYLAGVKDLKSVPQVSAVVQKATKTLDLAPELPKFNFPTMVIAGRYDMNVTPVTAWNIYKAIPGAKFVVFEKSGHLPSYEEPDKYVQVVEEFFSQR